MIQYKYQLENSIDVKSMTTILDFNGMKPGTGTTGSTLDTTGMDTTITAPDITTGMVVIGILLLVIAYLVDRHLNQRDQQE